MLDILLLTFMLVITIHVRYANNSERLTTNNDGH